MVPGVGVGYIDVLLPNSGRNARRVQFSLRILFVAQQDHWVDCEGMPRWDPGRDQAHG
jgi:hypothetical protein